MPENISTTIMYTGHVCVSAHRKWRVGCLVTEKKQRRGKGFVTWTNEVEVLQKKTRVQRKFLSEVLEFITDSQ